VSAWPIPLATTRRSSSTSGHLCSSRCRVPSLQHHPFWPRSLLVAATTPLLPSPTNVRASSRSDQLSTPNNLITLSWWRCHCTTNINPSTRDVIAPPRAAACQIQKFRPQSEFGPRPIPAASQGWQFGYGYPTRWVRVRGWFFTRGWHPYPTRIETGTFSHPWVYRYNFRLWTSKNVFILLY
jgi:hypothetical protein